MPVYLLHSTVPLYRANGQTVRHYLGYCEPGGFGRRWQEHLTGRHSARVVDAMRAQGATLLLGNLWPERGREDERRMKRNGHLSNHCLVCQLRTLTNRYDALLSHAKGSPRTSNGRSIAPGPNSRPLSGRAAPGRTVGSWRLARPIRSTVYPGRRSRYRVTPPGTGASSATARRATGGGPPAGTRR